MSTTPDKGNTEGGSMSELRQVLFDTLRGIKSGAMNIEQAKAVNEVAKTLVETAKVEVDYIRSAGGGESAFLDGTVGDSNLPPGVTRHRLK